ncbi:MAG: Oligopeptide-binding protein OppA [Chlamydiia bacterium]|nr:Oligopeptide-binding protein OppA [Chlamydiia bacterium]MCH9618307.1 Oligopeptide-binding protein OppA [Chlamydiia bacterium]MCH9624180.1 Oligopeptide-binding protein OppA [Chlamydiia bacterium]
MKENKIAQEISINIEKNPATLDGRKSTLLRDFNLIRTFNEGLYRINKDGVTTKAIAESCSLLPDKKTYIIKLKQTLWSDGTPLTAYDFVYAWKSALAKDFPAPSVSLLFPLKNAKAIKEGRVPSSMLGVHTQGAYTLVIELENETPYFKELLSLPIYFPIGETIDSNNPEWRSDNSEYICNGPFKISSKKLNNEIIAIKNLRYWDKDSVKLDKINMIIVDQDTAFNLYQNKELHLIGAPFSHIPPDALKTLSKEKSLKKNPMLRTHMIRVNTSKGLLGNKDFRKSLALSINRKDIVDHVLSSAAEIATGIVPISMGLQKAPYFLDADTESAKLHLNKACADQKMDKEKLPTFTFTYCGSGNNHKIAAALQDGWRKTLGLEVLLEPLEQKVYLDRISKGEYELASGAWAADFKDSINFLEVFKTRKSASNHTNWESPDYIQAIESTYACSNKKERKEALMEAESILIDEMPAIPVYHYSMLHLQNPQLKGVVQSETGVLELKWAYLTEEE